MSFLDGGAGERLPTAQTFLHQPPQNAPQASGTTPTQEEASEAVPPPPPNFPAWLKAMATMAEHQAARFGMLTQHKERWRHAAGVLRDSCLALARQCRLLAMALTNAPFPLPPVPERKGA